MGGLLVVLPENVDSIARFHPMSSAAALISGHKIYGLGGVLSGAENNDPIWIVEQ